MNRLQRWREYLLLRELYGILFTLSTRPYSQGNRTAVIEAQINLRYLLQELKTMGGQILQHQQVELIANLLDLSSTMPLQQVALLFLHGLKDLLREEGADHLHFTKFYKARFSFHKPIETVVISIGPTIDIGDEIILARALIERAQQVKMALRVETRRFGIWEGSGNNVDYLGPPPISSFEFICSLDLNSCTRIGYIFADNLASDPSLLPYSIPKPLAFNGRWVFGNASGIIIDLSQRHIYSFKLPEEVLGNRSFESAWIAARILPCNEYKHRLPQVYTPVHKLASPKKLLLQVLTSKPSLILPSIFYRKVLEKLLHLTSKPFIINILNGPGADEQIITHSVYESLLKTFSSDTIKLLNPLKIADIRMKLLNTDLLLGPDTFTAHLAANLGVPQVTLHLNRHRAWLNPASPSFFVVKEPNLEQLSEALARRSAFILNRQQFKDVLSHDIAIEWRTIISHLDHFLKTYFSEDLREPDLNKANQWVERINHILEYLSTVQQTIDEFPGWVDTKNLTTLTLASFREPEDAMVALTRWYHDLATSDLSGVLFNID